MITGVGRTALAMARERDLPGVLAGVYSRFQVPHRAELVLAAVVVVLVLTVDLRGAIGFSSFAVLVYYAIANAAAFTLPAAQRRFRRWLPVLGLVGCVGCVVLAASLPLPCPALVRRITRSRVSRGQWTAKCPEALTIGYSRAGDPLSADRKTMSGRANLPYRARPGQVAVGDAFLTDTRDRVRSSGWVSSPSGPDPASRAPAA